MVQYFEGIMILFIVIIVICLTKGIIKIIFSKKKIKNICHGSVAINLMKT